MKQNKLSKLEKAKQLRIQGNIYQAITEYREVFESNPNFFIHLKNLGNWYFQQKNFERAIRCYQRLLKAADTDIDILMSLGKAFEENKDNGNAIKYLEKILKIKPNFTPALKKIEGLYLQEAIKCQNQGSTEQAFIYFKKRMYLYSVDIDKVKKKLKRFGVQNYILRLQNSGISDQLIIAAMISRILDFLEINFQGVDRNSLKYSRTDGYWPILGKNIVTVQFSSYTLLGFDNIAVDTSDLNCAYLKRKDLPDEDTLALFFDQLLTICQEGKKHNQTIVFYPIAMRKWARIIPFLKGSNTFINSLKQNFQASGNHEDLLNQSHFCQYKNRFSFIKILFHLRLGDTANLDNLIPNKIINPWLEVYNYQRKQKIGQGIFDSADVYLNGRATNHWFLDLFRKASKKIGTELNGIILGLVTDGFEAAFSFIKESGYLQQVLHDYGVSTSLSFLDQKEQEKQEILMEDFKHLDFIVYGEKNFSETIANILDADIIVTSTGKFSFTISEYLSNKQQKRIIYNQAFSSQNTLLAQNPINSPEAVDELVDLIKIAISDLTSNN